MQISTKFTIAVHILTAVEYFSGSYKVTSDFLAGSIGSNPVIIRNIMSQLREAGIIHIRRGPGGITLDRSPEQITFLDIYKAVETNSGDELFRFHENPNPACPVGRNIHQAMDVALQHIQQQFENELSNHNLAEVYDRTEKRIEEEKTGMIR